MWIIIDCRTQTVFLNEKIDLLKVPSLKRQKKISFCAFSSYLGCSNLWYKTEHCRQALQSPYPSSKEHLTRMTSGVLCALRPEGATPPEHNPHSPKSLMTEVATICCGAWSPYSLRTPILHTWESARVLQQVRKLDTHKGAVP